MHVSLSIQAASRFSTFHSLEDEWMAMLMGEKKTLSWSEGVANLTVYHTKLNDRIYEYQILPLLLGKMLVCLLLRLCDLCSHGRSINRQHCQELPWTSRPGQDVG